MPNVIEIYNKTSGLWDSYKIRRNYMYSVKLDNEKYFTNSYAKVGKIDGGIEVESLPPTDDSEKALCYKYDYHDVIIEETVPDIDETTGEQKVDDQNNPLYVTISRTVSNLGWIFDEVKYTSFSNEKLESIKADKIKELGSICEQYIYNGVDVTTSNGVQHFTYGDKDQINIKNAFDLSRATGLSVSYHANGTPCRIFTAQEIRDIFIAEQSNLNYHTTFCNMLNTWVKRCTTIEEVNQISYESTLPEDLMDLLTMNLAQAQLLVNAIVNG